MAVAGGKNGQLFVFDANRLGGYKNGPNGEDDIILTIPLLGPLRGRSGAYPLEGGWLYAITAKSYLQVFQFSFGAGGKASLDTSVRADFTTAYGAGPPMITSYEGQPGTGVVWYLDGFNGQLVAHEAVPVNGRMKVLLKYRLPAASAKFVVPTFRRDRMFIPVDNGGFLCMGLFKYLLDEFKKVPKQLDKPKLLLECPPVNAAPCKNQAICKAAGNGRVEVVKLLLQVGGVDPTANDNQPIRNAAVNGHHAIVKLLLSTPGVDPTTCNNEAIRSASANHHVKVVDELLKVGTVDATAKNNQAFVSAAKNGDVMLVKRLLKVDYVRLSVIKSRALVVAKAMSGQEIVRLLQDQLNDGADQ
ncbi:hypothetical protein HDU76_007781 [Blyttiomyces sp. JEL0837]|nr:hypothetical protein HDU76_007781 [Blyttiomyces sp. JEL0837]